MGNIGTGTGTSYPTALDTQTSQEVNSPAANRTRARAEVPNDLASAVLALESTLGTKNSIIGGYTDSRLYSTINEAVAAAAGKTVLVSTACALAGNLTVPANVGLKIMNGGSIVKSSTYVLAIDGPFEAGLYQGFTGFSAGDVTFGQGSVKEVYPEWWGAVQNNAGVDCGPAIQSAVDTLMEVRLSLGKYYVSTPIQLKSYALLRGAGISTTFLIASGNNGIFTSPSSTLITVELSDFSLQGTGLGSTVGMAFGQSGHNSFFCVLRNIYAYNFTTANFQIWQPNNFILDNIQSNGGSSSNYGIYIDASAGYGTSNFLKNITAYDAAVNVYMNNLDDTNFDTFYVYTSDVRTDTRHNIHIVNTRGSRILNGLIENQHDLLGAIVLLERTAGGPISMDNKFVNTSWVQGGGFVGDNLQIGVVGESAVYKTRIQNCEFITPKAGSVSIHLVNSMYNFIERATEKASYTDQTVVDAVITNDDGSTVYKVPLATFDSATLTSGTITATNLFQLTNQTNGAGASVGSLNNTPYGGNPGYWLHVKINGIDRYIPAW